MKVEKNEFIRSCNLKKFAPETNFWGPNTTLKRYTISFHTWGDRKKKELFYKSFINKWWLFLQKTEIFQIKQYEIISKLEKLNFNIFYNSRLRVSTFIFNSIKRHSSTCDLKYIFRHHAAIYVLMIIWISKPPWKRLKRN